MFEAAGAQKPNPWNPSSKRLPRTLPDNSSFLPQEQPRLPSDGMFAAAAGEAALGQVAQLDVVESASRQLPNTSELYDKRAEYGYL
jgi:hypothetical protein